jgi:adenylate cyclase
MKLRLEVSVAATFAAVTTLMLGIVVTFLFVSNRDLAWQTAQAEMVQARDRSIVDIEVTLSQTQRAVDVAASLVGQLPRAAHPAETLNVMHALIAGDEQYYGIYFGLQESGAFYQNVVLNPAMRSFGPQDAEIPGNAVRVLRMIDTVDGAMSERFFWVLDTGDIVLFSEGPAAFDPRTRPWFQDAAVQDAPVVTDIYQFESTGRPGITFAKRIVNADGDFLGVVGADITMSALSKILEKIRIGDEGLVFMINEGGQLLSYTGTRASGEATRFVASPDTEKMAIESPVIKAVMDRWEPDDPSLLRLRVGEQRIRYLGAVTAIPEMFGTRPFLGFAVPADEFIGAIKRTTFQVLTLAGFVLLLSIVVTVFVARLLSRNLRLLADEARRISSFEFENTQSLKSSIREVSELNQAMTGMKAGLSSFGAYVPTDLVRSILAKSERVRIGGETREVTILFSDIRGFTSRTEHMQPEELMPALSKYFETFENQIAIHGGTVDKYIGDAIMALWNAPLDDERHCEHACRAVLACQAAEADMNATGANASLPALFTRFGLHCDEAVVGNVGSLTRMQYTVLGAAVNLASRVEALGKVYGTHVLATETVVARTEGLFCFRPIDVVSPAGTSKPIELFELVGEEDPDAGFAASAEIRAEIQRWNLCYDLYRAAKWQEALVAFQDHLSSSTNATLVELYIERCQKFIEQPPAADWDGVFRFMTK